MANIIARQHSRSTADDDDAAAVSSCPVHSFMSPIRDVVGRPLLRLLSTDPALFQCQCFPGEWHDRRTAFFFTAICCRSIIVDFILSSTQELVFLTVQGILALFYMPTPTLCWSDLVIAHDSHPQDAIANDVARSRRSLRLGAQPFALPDGNHFLRCCSCHRPSPPYFLCASSFIGRSTEDDPRQIKVLTSSKY